VRSAAASSSVGSALNELEIAIVESAGAWMRTDAERRGKRNSGIASSASVSMPLAQSAHFFSVLISVV